MIVDTHTHIGRSKHIKATVDQLLQSMDEAKIDKSLVIAGRINDADNEYLLENIEPHKDRLLGVGTIHPERYSYNYELKRQVASFSKDDYKKIVTLFKEKKIVACKFYLGYDYYYPNEVRWLLDDLQNIGCPAIFHCGDCLNTVHGAKLKYAYPLNIDDVAVDFPKLNMVIAHVGYPWQIDTAEVCFKNENVYTDISGFVYGDFAAKDITNFHKVIKEFIEIAGGTDKLLFGTDWPISNQKSYVDAVHDILGGVEVINENSKKVFNF